MDAFDRLETLSRSLSSLEAVEGETMVTLSLVDWELWDVLGAEDWFSVALWICKMTLAQRLKHLSHLMHFICLRDSMDPSPLEMSIF
jgi:hypothetical protein